jgi:hypothetical protein
MANEISKRPAIDIEGEKPMAKMTQSSVMAENLVN